MTSVPRRAGKGSTTAKKKLDLAELTKTFAEFRRLKRAESEAKRQHEKLRDEELMPALVAYGAAHGEQGQHLAIELEEEVDGLRRLVRRANKSVFINVDRAEALAEEGGYLPEIQVGRCGLAFTGTPEQAAGLEAALRVTAEAWAKEQDVDPEFIVLRAESVFDQGRLYAYHQLHRDEVTAKETAKKRRHRKPGTVLSQEQLDGLYDTETTYSFFPEK